MRARSIFVWLALCGVTLAACTGGSIGGDLCAGVSCSPRGICMSEGGIAYCACMDGFHPVGLGCEADDPARPCDGVACSGHGASAAAWT
jgi:hypothetical protein